MDMLPGGDPYPIDTDPQASGDYVDSVPPGPPEGADIDVPPAYAAMGRPGPTPGMLPSPAMLSNLMPMLDRPVKGFAYGLAGGAVAAATSKRSSYPLWWWGRAALGGIAICFLLRRHDPNKPQCPLIGMAAGYVAARFLGGKK